MSLNTNRMMKVKGGLCGITQNPASLARFFLVAPELTKAKEQVNHNMSNIPTNKRSKHHELSKAVMNRQGSPIQPLKPVIVDGNPF